MRRLKPSAADEARYLHSGDAVFWVDVPDGMHGILTSAPPSLVKRAWTNAVLYMNLSYRYSIRSQRHFPAAGLQDGGAKRDPLKTYTQHRENDGLCFTPPILRKLKKPEDYFGSLYGFLFITS